MKQLNFEIKDLQAKLDSQIEKTEDYQEVMEEIQKSQKSEKIKKDAEEKFALMTYEASKLDGAVEDKVTNYRIKEKLYY